MGQLAMRNALLVARQTGNRNGHAVEAHLFASTSCKPNQAVKTEAVEASQAWCCSEAPH